LVVQIQVHLSGTVAHWSRVQVALKLQNASTDIFELVDEGLSLIGSELLKLTFAMLGNENLGSAKDPLPLSRDFSLKNINLFSSATCLTELVHSQGHFLLDLGQLVLEPSLLLEQSLEVRVFAFVVQSSHCKQQNCQQRES